MDKKKKNRQNKKRLFKETHTKQDKMKERKREKRKRKKSYPPTQPIFPNRYFTCSLFVSSLISLERKSFTLLKLCYLSSAIFFIKAIVFFELFNAISFSIFLTFRISAMRLFIFMNFFSLDLWTGNLNVSRMWLIKTLLFSKKETLCTESRIPKMAIYCVKVDNISILKTLNEVRPQTFNTVIIYRKNTV